MEQSLLKENKKTVGPSSKTTSGALPPLLRNSAIHRKYGLTTVISEDFAGTLYATAKRAANKEVSVKVLKAGYALTSNTLGNIEHSRICQVLHTIIERDKIQAVVFEKPEGRPLSQMIRESGPLPPGQVVSAGLQLLSAIHAVHWNDAYIGNLHADSIFLSRDNRGNLELQLTNLGIGCIQDKLRETDYLAPEQIMGGKGGSKRSDLWAVGIILYEMLFGTRPFKGENRYAVAGEILLQEPDFSPTPKDVPEDLIELIRKAIRKEEGHRFTDAAQMVEELLPFQSEFNEPMSPAAQKAIRDSKPPTDSTSTAAKTAARTSAVTPKARIIPTVRISHTPSDPPDRRKPLHSNSGKRTKLGMPAISLPAKHIPLKSSDDTASFAAKDSNAAANAVSSTETSAEKKTDSKIPAILSNIQPGKAVSDRAISAVSRSITGARATLATAGEKITGGFPKLLANAPKPSEVKSGFLNLPLKLKALVLGSAALFVILLIVMLFVGDEKKPTTEVSAKAMAQTISKEIEAHDALLDSAAQIAAEADAETTKTDVADPIPAGKKVTISLNGKLPKRSRIRIDGKTVAPPITIDASRTPLTLTVSARGYETFSETITPLSDTTIDVELPRTINVRRRPNKGRKTPQTKKQKSGKSAKSGDSLAKNPFGE